MEKLKQTKDILVFCECDWCGK